MPVNPHELFRQAAERQCSTIDNTIADSARIGAARRELNRRRAEEFAKLDEIDDLDEPEELDEGAFRAARAATKAAITKRLHREISAEYGFGWRIPLPPRVLLSGSQGTGKTRTALLSTAAIVEPISVWFTAPTLDKCDENMDRYAKLAGTQSLPAMVVRGRGQPDPKRQGDTMCRRADAATSVAAAGWSVRKVMCETCKFKEECSYLDQQKRINAMGGVGVFFLANAGLLTPSPAPQPDLLIGDERIDPTMVSYVPMSDLSSDIVPYHGAPGTLNGVIEAKKAMDAIRIALREPNQLEALRDAGITRATLSDLIKRLTPEAERAEAGSGIRGDLPDDEIIRRVGALEDLPARRALTVLRAINREFDRPRAALNGVVLGAGDHLTISRLQQVYSVNKRTGILLLDGSGSYKLNRAPFGERLEHVEVRFNRKGSVIGSRGKSYSTQSVTGLDRNGQPMPAHTASSKRLRDELATIVKQMPSQCMFAGTLSVETAMVGHLPDGQPVAHFNKTRGLNTWEECLSGLVAGQTSTSVAALEATARCYIADDDALFVSSAGTVIPDDWEYKGWPYRCTRMRRMRDGSLSAVEVAIHPDPFVQEVFEQIREAEVIQTVDRPRTVFNERIMGILNSLVLDLTYDTEWTHAEFVAGGNKLDLAFATTGILPLGARDLHLVHERMFPTENIASKALKTLTLNRANLQRVIPVEVGPIYGYRRKGQVGRPSQVIIDLKKHPDPKAALVAALGRLAHFELISQPVPEKEVAMPELLRVPAQIEQVIKPQPAIEEPVMEQAEAPMSDLTPAQADCLAELFRRMAAPWPTRACDYWALDTSELTKAERWEVMPLAPPTCQAIPAMAT